MRIGVDLGGTKIEVILLDKKGNEVLRKRCKTPQGHYEDTIKAIVELILAVEKEGNVKSPASVGIGIPGAVSPKTGLIQNSNSLCLIGKALDEDLKAILKRPIRLENDANCFVLSEATDGAGENKPIVFGVILGTGVGGGITVNSKLVVGPDAITGEWGHNPLPRFLPCDVNDGVPRDCYCGKKGCIETYLSGPSFSYHHELMFSEKRLAAEIYEKMLEGDQSCKKSYDIYVDRLARALSGVINFLNPHVIVFGGGVSNMNQLYTDVPKAWEKYVFVEHPLVELKKAKWGDSSGVRGAAWLWPEGESI